MGSTSKNTSTMDGELPKPATSSSKRSTTSSENSCTQSSCSPCTLTSSVSPADTEISSVRKEVIRTSKTTLRKKALEKEPKRSSTRPSERLMAPTKSYENEWMRRWFPPRTSRTTN